MGNIFMLQNCVRELLFKGKVLHCNCQIVNMQHRFCIKMTARSDMVFNKVVVFKRVMAVYGVSIRHMCCDRLVVCVLRLIMMLCRKYP